MQNGIVRELGRVVKSAFPPVDFALAYGSAVYRQRGHKARDAMSDCMLGVRDARAWHGENMKLNAAHYPLVLRGAPAVLHWLQSCGARVIYLWDEPRNIKYGVVETGEALDVLETWRSLFVPGRLHKPVALLSSDVAHFPAAMEANRRHALNAALLMLPARFTLGELLRTVVGLSYAGDVRAGVAEDPRKVERIVDGQTQDLLAIYAPLMSAEVRRGLVACEASESNDGKLFGRLCGADGAKLEKGPLNIGEADAPNTHKSQLQPLSEKLLQVGMVQDTSVLAVSLRLAHLPSGVSIDRHGAQSTGRVRDAVRASLASLVRWPSAVQAASGLMTAGPVGSMSYFLRKIGRRFS